MAARRSAQAPTTERTHVRDPWYVIALPIVVFLGAIVFHEFMSVMTGWSLVDVARPPALRFLIPAGVLLVVPYLVWVVLRVRFRRRVAQHDFAVCARCYYPLTKLGERGRCPECGTEFDRSLLIQAWRAHFSEPRPPETDQARPGKSDR